LDFALKNSKDKELTTYSMRRSNICALLTHVPLKEWTMNARAMERINAQYGWVSDSVMLKEYTKRPNMAGKPIVGHIDRLVKFLLTGVEA
jgi:hypothetical protein